jgi:hypothetical protein
MLATVLFGQLPGDGRWVSDVSNAAHGPAFAVVTLVIFVLLRHWPARRMSLVGEYSAAILVSVLLGALVEVLQHFTGRDASLADLGTDFLGTVAAAGGLLAFDQPARRTPRLIAIFLTLAACALMIAPLAVTATTYLHRDRSFPTLLDLKSPIADTFLRFGESATAERVELPREFQSAARNDIGVRVQLSEKSGWVAVLSEPVPDWRGYTRLNVDVANPTDERLALRLRVFDRRNDRACASFTRCPVICSGYDELGRDRDSDRHVAYSLGRDCQGGLESRARVLPGQDLARLTAPGYAAMDGRTPATLRSIRTA